MEKAIGWLIIYGAIALIVWLISACIGGKRRLNASRHKKRAKEYLQEGNWDKAAASYKLAILERLDHSDHLTQLVNDLNEIYQNNGIKANLSEILKCPQMLKQISDSNISSDEMAHLCGQLYFKAAEILERYPGSMELKIKKENSESCLPDDFNEDEKKNEIGSRTSPGCR